MTTIDLTRAAEHRREHYGVLLSSRTVHIMEGVHNSGYRHQLDVWENRIEFADGREKCYLDPMGRATASRYSFLLAAQASVISLVQLAGPEQGENLTVGDVVNLTIEGFSIGWFQIMARPLHDPHLIPVDISTSASRQHYIDTGEYLEREIDD